MADFGTNPGTPPETPDSIGQTGEPGFEPGNQSRHPTTKGRLARRAPLRAKPRSKGNRAELEIITLLKSFGWTSARRNWQSGGQGGGDVIGGPADVHIEVKHHERCSIWEWIAQAESEARPTDAPAVFFRRNRSGWKVCIDADEYLALLRLRETA